MNALEETLADWKPDPRAAEALFSAEERDKLERARTALSPKGRTVAYVVYENPFARAGGIFAVASHLPPALRAAGDQTLLISPFHRNLATTPTYDELHFYGEIMVPFAGSEVKAELFEYFDKLGNRWMLVQSWSIFDAPGGATRTNPYSHVHPDLLLRDGLFLAQAVPQVLAHLGLVSNVVVHAQDWQTAASTLSVKQALLEGVLDSAACVVTSHNPYDYPLHDHHLTWITDRLGPVRWPLGWGTVYERMIAITDAPLSTVSPGFARELTDDPLQSEHFASHLQSVYRAHGVVGVNNPLFGESKSPFSKGATLESSAGVPDLIVRQKLERRHRMLDALASYSDPRIAGGLDGGRGNPLRDLSDDVPVFMMFGRLDPGQKGFDLLARAIEGFARGEAKFILTPIVSDPGPYADDLTALAEKRPGDVAVYPFRMERGYMEAMGGATFAVMPSLYEPFGAATEAYLAGTPVIARRSGGLTDQVNDYRLSREEATGILFREKLPLGTSWSGIVNASRPQDRIQIPLYVSIAEQLFDALQLGANLWRDDRTAYGRMLGNLYSKAVSFTGKKAAAGYQAIYETAARPR